ncbi:MAG TPA: hypothetical protein ENI23_15940 [bacterium]|nr:hypothetical protein [bacterium]
MTTILIWTIIGYSIYAPTQADILALCRKNAKSEAAYLEVTQVNVLETKTGVTLPYSEILCLLRKDKVKKEFKGDLDE